MIDLGHRDATPVMAANDIECAVELLANVFSFRLTLSQPCPLIGYRLQRITSP
jgi:hypothetical protein